MAISIIIWKCIYRIFFNILQVYLCMASKNVNIIDIIRDRKTKLPTLSVVASNVLQLASNDKTSAYDLAEFISKDQALTNKILRLSNSAYYGLVKKVDSIHRAITVIGFHDVTSLAVGISVFSSFKMKGIAKVLDMKDLWLHSICCATAAREISKKINITENEQIFLTALLHDTGKIIFALYFPEEYQKVLQEAAELQTPLFRKEQEVLKTDHAKVVGHLMERWNFPDNLSTPSRYHHDTSRCPLEYQKEVLIVDLANFLCHKLDIGRSGNTAVLDITKTLKMLSLTIEDVMKIVKEIKAQLPKMKEFLQLMA